MVEVVVVVWVDQVSHCHSVMAISPWWVMLLAVGEERVVDLWRWYLQLVVLTLAVQEAIELGQATEGQGVWDRGLRIFWQLLGLVARVVTVAGDQEAREEGTKDKGDQNTSDQESIMDTVIGLLQLRWPPHTFRTEKDWEKGTSVRAFLTEPEEKKTHTFSRANIGQVAAGTDRLCLQGLHYVGNSMGEVFELSSWLRFPPLLIDQYGLSF